MRKKAIINVAIGSTVLKMIYCESIGRDIVVKDFELCETNSSLFLNKRKLNVDFIENKIQMFLYKNNIKKGKICISLPDYIIGTNYTSDIEKSILDLVCDSNPDIKDKSDIILDVQDGGNLNQNSVIYSYISNENMISLKKMCKRLRLKGVLLEPESHGLVRCIHMFSVNRNTIIIDIGSISTEVITVECSGKMNTHILPVGVSKIDGLISSINKSSYIDSKLSRVEYGINQDNMELKSIIGKMIKDSIAMPITNILTNTRDVFADIDFSQDIYISGGGWSTPGLKDMLEAEVSQHLNADYAMKDYGEKLERILFESDDIKCDFLKNILNYSSCIGLMLRRGI